MNSFIFPCFNGNLCFVQNNAVLCLVRNNGSIFVQSYRTKYKPIPHFRIPFLRGLEYLIFGTFYFFWGLYLSFKSTPVPRINKKMSDSLNIKSSYIFGVVAFLLAIFLAVVFIGIVPTHLGYAISGSSLSIFVKKLVIAIVKVVMFYLILLFLYSFSSMRKLYKFNSAGNMALNGQTKLSAHRATNYLNFIVFCWSLNYFVVSLLGIEVSVWLKAFVNVGIFALISMIAFEICYILDKFLKKYSYPVLITSFFVTSKPAGTELQTANTALSEGNLMLENIRRQVINEDSQGGNVAFSLCYSEVREKLKQAGIEDIAETDWLIASVLNKNRAEIKLLTQISRSDYKQIQRVLERRVKGEPIDKIFGKTEFYGLTFKVNKDVLTPRKETEILVEEALKIIGKEKVEVLDLCTGSGAIAISMAKNSNAKVTASDISEDALKVAKINAELNEVKINFVCSDLFNDIKKGKKYDIITCNPPYIKSEDIKTLDREVKDFDPHIALDGGEDGLYFYRKLSEQIQNFISPKGVILLEIGKGQEKSVKKLFSKSKFSVRIVKDYSGVQRVIILERG